MTETYSTSLITDEDYLEWQYYITHATIITMKNIKNTKYGKKMEQLEHVYTPSVRLSWHSNIGKSCGKIYWS